ncbi:MAG: ADP-ribosylglycohydrolase family protein [Hydrogenophaga sp.]|nr:ADP-ribosylglycohydrolase family protein [Hydrogenophaga sp.]
MDIVDLAQGCLLGAFIGDSAGARLEFLGRRPSEQEIADALAMKGGGVLRVAPGQVTDDGELTLALARALVGEYRFPREKVAINYRAWLTSRPFDVGHATYASLSGAVQLKEAVADAVARSATTHNIDSKANGALMRASALGVWATRVTQEEAAMAACADTKLTHPNLSCQGASAAYVVAIRHLLLHPGDSVGAFAQAREVLVSGQAGVGFDEAVSWLDDAQGGALPTGYPMAGFVRIAFTHAFHHLLQETSFAEALPQVLACGGDTDTNACIVGGLVGARVGIQGIPEPMTRAVVECDTQKGRPRPDWLTTRDALELAKALLA